MLRIFTARIIWRMLLAVDQPKLYNLNKRNLFKLALITNLIMHDCKKCNDQESGYAYANLWFLDSRNEKLSGRFRANVLI